MTLILASDLHKSFGATNAVNGVSLDIAAGEIYGLVGSDGAGKTTTLRLLVGAFQPDRGEIAIGGCDIARQTEQARAQVGYLSQRFSLYEDLTVLENIRFFAEVRGLTRDEWLPRCMEILAFVGLADFKDRRAGQLSGGMKQKLGLASALVTRPRVLLLDEPTTGVDPVTRQDFWQLLIRLVAFPLAQAGDGADVAVIITTPYMDEASRCHRLGFMRAGQIIASGTPSDLRARLQGRIMELRGAPLDLLRRVAAQLPEVENVRLFGDRLHLRLAPGRSQAATAALEQAVLAAGGSLSEARPVSPTLEDVFIELSEQA
ncbi:MAG: ABC transporter ATP-binding protein [Anaerolineales bacterium]|nr:ABC transporter ATP-binding protein [Anaerolineales bacterium]